MFVRSSTLNVSTTKPENADVATDGNTSKEGTTTVVEKLLSIGLKQVQWHGKCEGDKIAQGKYEVLPGEGGDYALIFDNTFSKSTPKVHDHFLGCKVHKLTCVKSDRDACSFDISIRTSSALRRPAASFATRRPVCHGYGSYEPQ